jgi:hypothetical protein
LMIGDQGVVTLDRFLRDEGRHRKAFISTVASDAAKLC